jgi:hypothetical protein
MCGHPEKYVAMNNNKDGRSEETAMATNVAATMAADVDHEANSPK